MNPMPPPMPAQPMPPQTMPGQPMPPQTMPGQPMPPQTMPGQTMPGMPMPAPQPILIVNTETIPGCRITEVKGLVQGRTVRAKNGFRDIAASFKNAIGGELKGYTELLDESGREAGARMVAQAQALGANAILNVRFSSSAIAERAAEVMVYGTAVIVVPET